MALYNPNWIWNGALAYVQGIDIKAEVEALAALRPWISRDEITNQLVLNAAPDPLYEEDSRVWRVDRGPLDAQEDILPIVRVDLLDAPHQTSRKSADNYCQFWWIQMLLAIASIAGTREQAEMKAQDCEAVMFMKWMGSGSRMGMDQTMGIHTSWLTSGGWTSWARNDGWIAVLNLLLTVEAKVTLPRP